MILINLNYKSDTTDSMLFDQISLNYPDSLVMSTKNGNLKFKRGLTGVVYNFIELLKLNHKKIYVTSTPFENIFLVFLITFFKRKVKVYFHVHDMYPDFFRFTKGYKIYYNILKPIGNFIYRNAHIITISEKIKDYICLNYKPKYPIQVIENFSDIDVKLNLENNYERYLLYVGNVGFAHDMSYLDELIEKTEFKIKFKLSGVPKYHKRKNPNLEMIYANQFVEVIEKRLSLIDLSNLIDNSFATLIFLGDNYDKVLFPCKIYSSLSRCIPLVFVGNKDNYVCNWIINNNFGIHFSEIDDLEKNRKSILKSIMNYNSTKKNNVPIL